MPLALAILLVAVALVAGVVYGRKTAPVTPPPEPKRFGLKQAEAVKEQLGSLSATQAQAAQVAALVGGMQYILPAEVERTRTALANAVATETEKIADLRRAIGQSETKIVRTKARDAEIAELATAFAV